MRVLVTGASGFVGNSWCSYLKNKKFHVVGLVRSLPQKPLLGVDCLVVEGFSDEENWREILGGIDVVVHCAARVHVMQDKGGGLDLFRKINVIGTACIAKQAAINGVKRFIYLSSAKVNGERTYDCPFRADDQPSPEDDYSVSKWEAEQTLIKVSKETKLEIVIIRPPLIYGPGVKANFLRLIKLVDSGIPLPLGSIHNLRSLVALENLVSLIEACISHPAAIGQTFLVSDDEDVSTSILLKKVANAIGRPDRSFPVPEKFLWLFARLFGKKNIAQRICGSLQLDIEKTKALLGWLPKISMDKALLQTVKYYQDNRNRTRAL